MKEGLSGDITAHKTIQTVEDQEYRDPTFARIRGDKATFTGAAGDKIDVWIDGTEYADIDVSACTTIALVVTAINTAVGSTVAYATTDGYLEIKSLTTGASSAVKIEDDAAASGAVDDLFSDEDYREQDAITDIDEIIVLTEKTNDNPIDIIPYHRLRKLSVDPSNDTATSPLQAAWHRNYLYFRPRPTSAILIYIDYYIDVAAITTASTMPFKDKYDPIIVELAKKDLKGYLDGESINVNQAWKDAEFMLSVLLSGNIAQERQLGSRYDEEPYLAPRKPTEMGS